MNIDIKGLKKKANAARSMIDILNEDLIKDTFPASEDQNNKTNDVEYAIVYVTSKNVAYTDLTGRFPYRLSRGNEYILVTAIMIAMLY